MGVVGQAMAVFGAVFFLGLLGPFALVVGTWSRPFADPGLLACGQGSLQLTLPSGWEGNASFVLTAWDTEGKAHALQNDSGCGLWVSDALDGSRVVSVSYTSCYVFGWDGNYFIIVGLEGTDAAGQKVVHEEKLFMCPADLPALDAPSSSVCSAVRSQDRLPCASLPISQGDCEVRGCCYNPRDKVKTCYYGNTVTAHCTPDGQFSIAVSRDVTLPPVILDSVHLASGHSAGCVPVVKNKAFVVYQFPLSACGTTFQVTGDQAVYENELVASRDVKTGSLGSVTRDSTFRLHVRCSYAITGTFVPLSVQVFTLPPLPAVSQPGPLSLELRVASDERYSSYYTDNDYPVVKALRDPIYIEVRILQRTDPDLVLVLHHCWATPSINPHQQTQWPVLVNGCPYAGDNYQTQLVPLSTASGLLFPSHYQRFTLYTFTFVDSASQEVLSGLVYLHCSASVCHRSVQESCANTCPARARGKRSAEHTLKDSASRVSSKGPVIFLQDELRRVADVNDFRAAAASWALGFAAVAAGAVLGMVLVAAVLWWRK
ncbi:zona pellucida sperm-binding protein 4 [Gallus gallus]|uniref:Zona pellucida sperm-binding protein 4 n=1 Tax=Gallus gallus TaxID=9031 RepID=Q9W645_CHICK|nr:zona pellucida sperm-binding protein 4 [Gallus gallus]BAA76739.1 zona pellucida B protein [Gallus gallus]|eukprot:NP_990210.1 zona pellucida sperm-binding protein 4 [Gallus gallus]